MTTASEQLKARIELLKKQNQQQRTNADKALVQSQTDLGDLKDRLNVGEFTDLESFTSALDEVDKKFYSTLKI